MLTQPVGIQKLTNVAFVKYRIGNQRFYIACYKNKVLDWRDGTESDLGEVLQQDQIYLNPQHGKVASDAQIKKYFPHKTHNQIMALMLDQGELQIGDKERDIQQGNLYKDIINGIWTQCVHPVSLRRFSIETIRKMFSESHFAINPQQQAKPQIVRFIKKLSQRYNIMRANMEIRISVAHQDLDKLKPILNRLQIFDITEKTSENDCALTLIIQPHLFRVVLNDVKKEIPTASIEVVNQQVIDASLVEIEDMSDVQMAIKDNNHKFDSNDDSDNEIANWESNSPTNECQNRDEIELSSTECIILPKATNPIGHMQSESKPDTIGDVAVSIRKDSNAGGHEQQQNKTENTLLQAQKHQFTCTYCPDAFFDDRGE